MGGERARLLGPVPDLDADQAGAARSAVLRRVGLPADDPGHLPAAAAAEVLAMLGILVAPEGFETLPEPFAKGLETLRKPFTNPLERVPDDRA